MTGRGTRRPVMGWPSCGGEVSAGTAAVLRGHRVSPLPASAGALTPAADPRAREGSALCEDAMNEPAVQEIVIDRQIVIDRSPECLEDADRRGWGEVCAATDVLAAIEDARARGVRVLLVRVTGPGGHVAGAEAIVGALEAFSAAGGFVLTFASGQVMSCAPLIALAGDLVCAEDGAAFVLHSSNGPTVDDVERTNECHARYLADRTAIPLEQARAAFRDYRGVNAAGHANTLMIRGCELLNTGASDGFATIERAREIAQEAAFVLAIGFVPVRRRDPGGNLAVVRDEWRRLERRWHVAPAGVVDNEHARKPRAVPSSAVTCSVSADKIAAGSLATTNYTEDGSGNATAGAKLDHTGTALKVAPGNLQLGAYVMANLMQAVYRAYFWINSSGLGSGITISNAIGVTGASHLLVGGMAPTQQVKITFGAPVGYLTDYFVITHFQDVSLGSPYQLHLLNYPDATSIAIGISSGSSWVNPQALPNGIGFQLVGFKLTG